MSQSTSATAKNTSASGERPKVIKTYGRAPSLKCHENSPSRAQNSKIVELQDVSSLPNIDESPLQHKRESVSLLPKKRAAITCSTDNIQDCSLGEVKQKSINDFFKSKTVVRIENSSDEEEDDGSGNIIIKRQRKQAYPLIPRFNSENNAKTHSCSTSPPKKRVKQAEQMFLDFGQKNFGTYTCPECHMPYSRGTVEDEAIHAKYHKAVVRGIAYTSYKHEIMLKQFPEDNSRIMMLVYSQSNPFEKRK
ncbi:5755_t:CDS:2, partial [Dentiscutata heterogama]